jgi:murein DD-endopeptidase MepM/ murein hydrolase activator NlpD
MEQKLMEKYSIVFYDSSRIDKMRRFNVTKVHAIVLGTVFAVLVIALVSMLMSIGRIMSIDTASMPVVSSPASANIAQRMIPQEEVLEEAITMLQKDDAFVREVYDTVPVLHTHNTFEDVAGEFGVASTFHNAFSLNQRNNFQNMHAMQSLADMLSAELDVRIAKYQELEDYLEEQYIIYRHTPNLWPSPVERVTSAMGFRRSPFTGVPSYHEGTDLSAPTGTPIISTADGVVVFSGVRSGYGYLVTVDHGFGFITRYAHNSVLIARVGDWVSRGDLIALSGNTGRSAGPHSHYEVLHNGVPVNSVKFLPNEGK